MHDRLKKARIAAGFRTATAAIEHFGWKGSTYRAHENGQNQFKANDALRYGQAFEVSAGWLLTGESGRAVTSPASEIEYYTQNIRHNLQAPAIADSVIPIRGVVAAGVWREASVTAAVTTVAMDTPFPADSAYPLDAQFDLIVDDHSLESLARSGDFIRCIDFAAAQLEPGDGDLVVIERRRQNLVETTARRLRRQGDRLEFFAVNNDSGQAVAIVKDADVGDDVRIVAKIIWVYRPV